MHLSHIRDELSFEGFLKQFIESRIIVQPCIGWITVFRQLFNWREFFPVCHKFLSHHLWSFRYEFVFEGVVVVVKDLDTRLELVDFGLHQQLSTGY